MSAERVTVSLPSELVARARAAVSSGEAPSVSAYVAEAIRSRAEKTEALRRLEATLGGRPPLEELNAVRARWGLPPLPAA
jgi:Arc/MetJ-type ribon-helix-helix transcriptional regulator